MSVIQTRTTACLLAATAPQPFAVPHIREREAVLERLERWSADLEAFAVSSRADRATMAAQNRADIDRLSADMRAGCDALASFVGDAS